MLASRGIQENRRDAGDLNSCAAASRARSGSWTSTCRRATLRWVEQEHVLGKDGQFHVEDEAVDISIYGWEDWITFALFWIMAAVVFYQVYTRYVLSDSAGWTEEIARYFLVAVVFIGASMSVRKNNHIQVDYFYRLMPEAPWHACFRPRSTWCAACSSATPCGSPGCCCSASATSRWR